MDQTKAAAESAAIDTKAAAGDKATFDKWASGLTSGMESATSRNSLREPNRGGRAFYQVWTSAMDFAIRQMYQMLARLSTEIMKTGATHAGNAARTASDLAHATASTAADTASGATHATVEGAKTTATLTGSAIRVATEIAASVATMAKKVAEGVAWIAVEGWKAMASAWASISAIPVVGRFLAPAVAAGVLASVIAIGAHIAWLWRVGARSERSDRSASQRRAGSSRRSTPRACEISSVEAAGRGAATSTTM